MLGFGPRVRKTLAAHLALGLALLLTPAAAQATLLIRSDGAGLFVRDNNALSDRVDIRQHPDISNRYQIENRNALDVFKFDAQGEGCSAPFGSDKATCFRNGPQMRVELQAGSDNLFFRGAQVGQSVVVAGSGNDDVFGHNGRDDLNGGTGSDELDGFGGDDLLLGRDGADRLIGGFGADRLAGDEGADSLFGDEDVLSTGGFAQAGSAGADVLEGGDGNDFLMPKEVESTSVADTALCGPGFDIVEADLRDSIGNLCEQVDRSPVGETPHVVLPRKVLDVNRAGVAQALLRCPRRTTIGCRGALSLRLAKRGARRPTKTRYAIRAGRSATVRVRLTAAEARRIRGRGILTSLERGKLGPKTTIRQPRLR